LNEPESSHLLRATVGIERGWLVKSFNWIGILDARSGILHLRLLRPHAQGVRTTLLAVLPGISWILVLLSVWRYMNSYFSTTLDGGAALIWLVFGFVLFFVLWFLGTLVISYILDYLTLGIQVRYSVEVCVLGLKDVRMGRFRHVLDVVVEKEILPSKTQGTEFLITVLGTRKRLRHLPSLNKSTTDILPSGSKNSHLTI